MSGASPTLAGQGGGYVPGVVPHAGVAGSAPVRPTPSVTPTPGPIQQPPTADGWNPQAGQPSPRTMYEVFDTVAKQGVKCHVTEMLLPIGDSIMGPVRRGIWTPQLQADFLEQYTAVCFSNPNVELLNFWGLVPDGWGDSAGLLDERRKPRPAFDRLKTLITQTWHTRLDTTLPVDGTLTTRAFHGDYELAITTPDGKTITTTLTVPEQTSADIRIVLDTTKGTAVLAPPATQAAAK